MGSEMCIRDRHEVDDALAVVRRFVVGDVDCDEPPVPVGADLLEFGVGGSSRDAVGTELVCCLAVFLGLG